MSNFMKIHLAALFLLLHANENSHAKNIFLTSQWDRAQVLAIQLSRICMCKNVIYRVQIFKRP